MLYSTSSLYIKYLHIVNSIFFFTQSRCFFKRVWTVLDNIFIQSNAYMVNPEDVSSVMHCVNYGYFNFSRCGSDQELLTIVGKAEFRNWNNFKLAILRGEFTFDLTRRSSTVLSTHLWRWIWNCLTLWWWKKSHLVHKGTCSVHLYRDSWESHAGLGKKHFDINRYWKQHKKTEGVKIPILTPFLYLQFI